MYGEIKRYCFFYAVGSISFEKAKEIKSKLSNVLLITEFAQVNIIVQALPVKSSFLFHVFIIWKRELCKEDDYHQPQLKCENYLLSKSDGKVFGFELLRGFGLLNSNRCTIWAKNSPYHKELTSERTNLLCKVRNFICGKVPLVQNTGTYEERNISGSKFTAILQSVSTG